MSVDFQAALAIARARIRNAGYAVYDDFAALKPANESGGFWLQPLKAFLLASGFRCHEARRRSQWGACGYPGVRTHFH
jgi:hypothetical protein